MRQPEFLIVDEPTSGLDSLMKDEFERLLRGTAASERTVFLASHELDKVQRVADRVSQIKEGRYRSPSGCLTRRATRLWLGTRLPCRAR
jgi:ABC-2 type transport system ATP-binding protein